MVETMFPWNFSPLNKELKERLQNMKPEEVENFISGIMGKVLPSHLGGMKSNDIFNNSQNPGRNQSSSENQLNITSFETHAAVFVRIPITDEKWLTQLRIYHTANQLIIEHLPKIEDKQTLALPVLVKKKGATAKWKDGILEIKLVKSLEMNYSQIDVTELM
jgi:HSP20 family molecular chaperone IbpA